MLERGISESLVLLVENYGKKPSNVDISSLVDTTTLVGWRKTHTDNVLDAISGEQVNNTSTDKQ